MATAVGISSTGLRHGGGSGTKLKDILAQWGDHTFKITESIVYSFEKLTLKGYSETEDKTKSKQKFVKRKNSKPYELSLTIPLSRFYGIKDVKKEATGWVDDARQGISEYMYIYGDKLMKCKFMLTEADVSEVEILPTGVWISCNVKCTFKQSSVIDGTTTTSSSHHHSSGSGKHGTTSSGDVDAITSAAPHRGSPSRASSLLQRLNRVSSAAKTKSKASSTIRFKGR